MLRDDFSIYFWGGFCKDDWKYIGGNMNNKRRWNISWLVCLFVFTSICRVKSQYNMFGLSRETLDRLQSVTYKLTSGICCLSDKWHQFVSLSSPLYIRAKSWNATVRWAKEKTIFCVLIWTCHPFTAISSSTPIFLVAFYVSSLH